MQLRNYGLTGTIAQYAPYTLAYARVQLEKTRFMLAL